MELKSTSLGGIQKLHQSFVLERREETLARSIVAILPAGVQKGLDVGCGDGIIAARVAERTPGLVFQGVEVLHRKTCKIEYSIFDGKVLPFADQSFDLVETVDVLHHTDHPEDLVREIARVSRRYVVIKDHLWKTRLDFAVLSFMDWVGNRSYGVRLPDNYQKREQWEGIFSRCGLSIVEWKEELGLYPFPFKLVFENGKHFLALLEKR